MFNRMRQTFTLRKTPWLVSLGLFFATLYASYGQVNAYTFAQSAGAYSAISGGTVYGNTSSDDPRFVTPLTPLGGTTTTGIGLPIGFNFTYNGTVYNVLAINNNGWISLGSSSLTPSVNIVSTSSYTPLGSTSVITPSHLRNRIAALAADLQAQTGSELRLQTIGVSPNRTCVVQWTNYRRFGTAGTGQNMNFQIRLNETSNTVQVVFGAMTWNATSSTAQIGLGGTVNTDYNNRTTTTNWNTTTAGGSNTASCTFNTTVTIPVSGTTFTWTPASCVPPGAPVASAVTNSSATMTWTSSPTALNYSWELRTGSSCAGGSVVNSATGVAGLTTNLSSLLPNTQYTFCVVANCTGPTTSNASSVTFTTACDPFSVPVTETFEGLGSVGAGVVSACWNTSFTTGANMTTANAPVRNGIGAYAGTRYIWARWASNTYLYSVPVALTAGTTYYMTYQYANTDAIAGFYIKNKVGTAPTPTPGGQTITMNTIANPVNTTFNLNISSFTPTSSGTYYFSIHDSTTTSAPWYFCIDNIEITDVSPCGPITALTNTAMGTVTASYSWTGGVGASSYDWELRTSGACGSGAPLQSGNQAGTTLNLASLTANTTYTLCVRSNCGGPASTWTSTTFTTNCTPVAMGAGLYEDFGATTPSCWRNETGPASADPTKVWQYFSGASDAVPGPQSGTHYAQVFWTPAGRSLLISPPMDFTTLGVPQGLVNFWVYRGTSGTNDSITVHVNTTPSVTGATRLIKIPRLFSQAPAEAAAGWYQYSANIPVGFNVSSNVYVVFDGVVRSAFSPSLDNVYIGPPPPATVGAILVSQSPAGTSSVVAGTSQTTVLRVDIPVNGGNGTLTLNSIEFTYTGDAATDVAASGVRLWKTTGTTFTTPTQVGSAVSISAGSATFSGLGEALSVGTSHYWVTVDVSGTAVENNTIDFSVVSGDINIVAAGGASAPGPYPAALADPVGGRVVVGNLKYVFSQSVGTYTPNTDVGRTTLPDYPLETFGDDWDEIIYLDGGNYSVGIGDQITGNGIPIGFPFTYNGTVFNNFGVCTNGYIKLGNNPMSITNTLSSAISTATSDFASIIAPLHRDLEGYPTGEISYQTQGVSPNRVLVVQWTQFRVFASTDLFNFQIQLHENGNKVEFHYDVVPFQTRTFVMGIKGNRPDNDISNVNTRNRTVTTQLATTLPVMGTTVSGTGPTVSIPPGFDLTSGTVFTYTPTTCGLAVQALNSFTGVSLSTATVNWDAVASASGYQLRYRQVNPVVQGFSTATWATPINISGSGTNIYNLTGLDPNATYVMEVRNMCSPGIGSEFSPARSILTDPAANDIQGVSILDPTIFSCYTALQPVVARFRNVGIGPITAGTVVGLRVNVTTPGGPVPLGVNYVVPANIAVNATFDVTFPSLNMSTPGSYSFNTAVTWPSDLNAANDVLGTPVVITAYSSVNPSPTYSIGLNNSVPTGGIFTSTIAPLNPWTYGTGSIPLDGIGTIAPQEGSHALYFEDQLFDNATVRFITPCINLPTCYEVRFFASRYASATTTTSGTSVKVSLDGGVTFSSALTMTNVTRGKTSALASAYLASATTPVWDEYVVNLSAYGGQEVRIAFEGIASFNDVNWAIDNIRITAKNSRDVALTGITSGVNYATCNATSIPVFARVTNYGCGPASGFSVAVTVTGPLVSNPANVGATFTGSLAEGGSTDVFLGNVFVNGPGDLAMTGTVTFTGDVVPANNTMPATSLPLRSRPVSSLTLTNANVVVGNGVSINGSVNLGSASALFSASPNLAIPDNNVTGVSSSIVVSSLPGSTLAASLEAVSIVIGHPHVGDLRVRLEAPGGTTINLVNRRGNTGDDFINTRFRSGALISGITEAQAPYFGTWEPEQPFSTFGAAVANGTWRLLVDDNAAQDVGTILYWSMELPNQLQTASWTSVPPIAPFPQNFTAPIGSITPTGNPFGAAYPAGSYDIILSASDASGCVLSRDTTVNFFTTNTWLGLVNAPLGNNWVNPSNWIASPAPPTATVAVTIPAGTPFPPTITGTATVGSITTSGTNSNINLGAGAVLDVKANWTGGTGSSVTGAGLVRFSGTSGQTIDGITDFNNVEVSKTAGSLDINGTANIVNALTFNPASVATVTVGGSARLALVSNASGTGRIGVIPAATTIAGNVTMERYVPGTGDGWFFLGSPMIGRNFNDWADDFKTYGPLSGFGAQGGDIIPLGVQHATIFEYRENVHNTYLDTVQKRGWRAPANTSIENGRGYRVYIERGTMYSPNTFENRGPVAQQNVTFPSLTRNTFVNCNEFSTLSQQVACTENWRGWNLMSNPYPSPIDWDAASGWTKPGDMQNTIYRYNHLGSGDGYGLYNNGSGWLGALPAPAQPNIIPSSQAFFVKMVSGTSATMSCTEAVKAGSGSNGEFARTNVNTNNRLKITMEQPGVTGYGYLGMVRFMPEGSNGLDPQLDFFAMSTSGYYFSFPVDGSDLLLNTMGSLSEQVTIPLRTFFKGTLGTYRFNFTEIQSFDNGVEIYLRDNLLGILHNVKENPQYVYQVSSSDASMTDRFELIFNPASITGIRNLSEGVVFGVHPNPTVSGASEFTLSVKGIQDADAQITLVDVVGKVVYRGTMNLNGAELTEKLVKVNLSSGVYTVRFNSSSKSFTEKLVVR